MKTVRSFEASVTIYLFTLLNIPEYLNLQQPYGEDPKRRDTNLRQEDL